LERPSIKITFQLLEHGDINTTVMESASEEKVTEIKAETLESIWKKFGKLIDFFTEVKS
jgi:hypothetical protein